LDTKFIFYTKKYPVRKAGYFFEMAY